MDILKPGRKRKYETEYIQRLISESPDGERVVIRELYEDDIECLLINISLFSREMQEFTISKLLKDRKEEGAYLILNYIKNIPLLTSEQVTQICGYGYGSKLVSLLEVGQWADGLVSSLNAGPMDKESRIRLIIDSIVSGRIAETIKNVMPLNGEFDEVTELARISQISDEEEQQQELQVYYSSLIRQRIALSIVMEIFEGITDIDPQFDVQYVKTFQTFLQRYGLGQKHQENLESFIIYYLTNREKILNIISNFTNNDGSIDIPKLYNWIITYSPYSTLGKIMHLEDITRVEVGKYSILFYYTNPMTEIGEYKYDFGGMHLGVGSWLPVSVELIEDFRYQITRNNKIHEHQHAFYSYLMFWFRPIKYKTQEESSSTRLTETEKNLNELLTVCLDHAKNEILACISNGDWTKDYIINLFDIKNKRSSYNYPEQYREIGLGPLSHEQLQKYISIIEESVRAAFRLLDYLKNKNRGVPYEVIYRIAKNFLTFAPFDQWEFWVDEYIRTGH